MKKIAFLSVVFGILFMHFGCEKEPEKTKENPKFTLSISPVIDTVVVGEKVPITIQTEGGDSVTFKSNETATVHSYSRPAGLTGIWEIVDTLYVSSEGSNQAYVTVYQFIEGPGYPIVKYGHSNIVGRYPEIKVSANPSQIPWRTSTSIQIETFGGDSLGTDLTGVNDALNGTFETPLLDVTTTYHFVLFRNAEKIGEDSITIHVDVPTMGDILCVFGLLGRDKIYTAPAPGEPFEEWPEDYCLADDTREFHRFPEQKVIDDFGQELCGLPFSSSSAFWSMGVADTIILDGRPFGLEIRHDTVFFTSQLSGATQVVKETFIVE